MTDSPIDVLAASLLDSAPCVETIPGTEVAPSLIHTGQCSWCLRKGRPGWERSVILTCDPPGGAHPRAADACALLDEAGGDFTKLTGDPYAGACPPDLWGPVVATAFGGWRGQLTWYWRSFRHSCDLEVSTWHVYHRSLEGTSGFRWG